MAMTNQQLQELLAAIRPATGRGSRRLSSFSSGDGAEWRVWRDNFVIMARLQDWTVANQRDLLRVHMEGDAKRHTQHIVTDNRPIADILGDYDRAFLPAASSKLARSQFKTAAQLPQESMQQWGSRLRELFVRAYPEHAANAGTQVQLREAFAEGIRDPLIREYVQDKDEESLDNAVQAAQAKEANLLSFRSRQSDGAMGTARGRINAMAEDGDGVNAMGNKPAECWTCGDLTHFKQDCPKFKAQKKNKKFVKNKKGRGGKFEGRSRRGGKTNGNNRSISL